ncbi:hypothetical protein KC887_02955 [Candidatus Kaiserbacteria bacterium]|nr:hypothetical protein [Candidatus Kaiserbacteria bacterium]
MYNVETYIRCARKNIERADRHIAIVHLTMGVVAAVTPEDEALLYQVADEIGGRKEVEDRVMVAKLAYTAYYADLKLLLQDAKTIFPLVVKDAPEGT